jgi:hypothetical protein
LKVDSPDFYFADGNIPIVFTGKTNDWIGHRFGYDSAYFTDFVPLDTGSFVIRALDSRTQEYELGKMDNGFPHVQLFSNLLEKQVDGRFCVDGMMNFDKETASLVYVYYYRNQYLVMNDELHLLFRGRTIDTIRKAHIKVGEVSSNNSRTMAAPPLVVNKKSCVSDNRLFVNSGLLASNEDKETFDKASVVDVYTYWNGEYNYSFYVFDYKEYKMRDFRVIEDRVITLFDHFIFTYRLEINR